MTINDNLSGTPSYTPSSAYAAQAAVAAVNKTCEDGRPIQDIFCDDGGTAKIVTGVTEIGEGVAGFPHVEAEA